MSEPNGSESRLDRVERMLDEMAVRNTHFMAALEVQRVNIESLHANIHELFENSQRHDEISQKHDSRIAALI